jgi:hypothetical protein
MALPKDKKKKQTPLDLMRAARDASRRGFVRGSVPVATVRKKGAFPSRPVAKKGAVVTSPAAYAQSMIQGMGARMRQEYVGGPYVGPFRFRPNHMGSTFVRRDED